MLTSGQIIAVTIEKPAAGGGMIARVDGQVVLVTGAIPGELVRARVTRVSTGMAFEGSDGGLAPCRHSMSTTPIELNI